MATDLEKIENLRNKYEMSIMAIDGVETVSVGLAKNGKPCLVIGTSISDEQVRARLPEEIFSIPIEIVFVGKINAE